MKGAGTFYPLSPGDELLLEDDSKRLNNSLPR